MLSVLTQNIWGGAPFWRARREALARRIAATRPDLIGLQEVHAADPAGAANQALALADRVGGYDALFAAGRTTPSGRCEGVAILTRHPVRSWEATRLTRDRGDALDHRFGPRVVLRAVVEAPDGVLDVLVTHLSISRRARARTVAELAALTGAGPALLLGDLNADPDEPTIDHLRASGWLDTWAAANAPDAPGGTWPSPRPWRRIDYILAHPAGAWAVRSCEREPMAGSDHRGVLARLSTASIRV